MCDYTKVQYACNHLRYTVRYWCKSLVSFRRIIADIREGTRYQETHKRCPANVVEVEYRLSERCGKIASPGLSYRS